MKVIVKYLVNGEIVDEVCEEQKVIMVNRFAQRGLELAFPEAQINLLDNLSQVNQAQ